MSLKNGELLLSRTSYAALVNRGQLKKGEWCLIHAAAGGVGIAAVQIAKGKHPRSLGFSPCLCIVQTAYNRILKHISIHLANVIALGARVIATASSEQKLEFVRKHGGLSLTEDHTLVYNDAPASGGTDSHKKAAKLLEWQARVLKITKGKGVDVVFDDLRGWG